MRLQDKPSDHIDIEYEPDSIRNDKPGDKRDLVIQPGVDHMIMDMACTFHDPESAHIDHHIDDDPPDMTVRPEQLDQILNSLYHTSPKLRVSPF